MFYEGLYLYQKTGVNTARTLYQLLLCCHYISNFQYYLHVREELVAKNMLTWKILSIKHQKRQKGESPTFIN
jgi:hypothetical protein